MNPRYLPPPERQSRSSRQLGELAQLAGLSNAMQGPQLEQRAQGEREHQSRIAAALQLLGLQQQQEGQQAQLGQHAADSASLAEFRNNQLASEAAGRAASLGQQNAQFLANQDSEQMKLANSAAEHAAALGITNQHNIAAQEQAGKGLGAGTLADLLRVPGMTVDGALKLAGTYDPALTAQGTQMSADARARAVQSTAGQLKLIIDPAAREAHGRATLSQFPGGYEEALKLAGYDPSMPTPAQSAQLGGMHYTGPSIEDKGLIGVLADMPPAQAAAPESAASDNPFTWLLGKDNWFNRKLKERNR